MHWSTFKQYFMPLFALVLLIAVSSVLRPHPVRAETARLKGINAAIWYTWPRFNSFDTAGVFWPPIPPNRRMPNEQDFVQIKSLGFSTVRLGVDPALFMGLEGSKRQIIEGRLLDTVALALDADLSVIFDLHPNSRHKFYGQSAYSDFSNINAIDAYVKMVGEVASLLSRFEKQPIFLELMNEPRAKCTGRDQSRWDSMLASMLEEATAVAPELKLVVSGACASSIEGLLALKPKNWTRKDLLFTFHFYEPFPFTHQSAPFIPWGEKYLADLPWPPQKMTSSMIEDFISTNSISKLPPASRKKAEEDAAAVLAKYVNSSFNAGSIRSRLVQVAQWADENGISRSSILMGEFGVYRGTLPGVGASCEDRAAWAQDVRSVLDELGFSWTYHHLDGPFGVLEGQRRTPDMALLKALGLRSEGSCTGK